MVLIDPHCCCHRRCHPCRGGGGSDLGLSNIPPVGGGSSSSRTNNGNAASTSPMLTWAVVGGYGRSLCPVLGERIVVVAHTPQQGGDAGGKYDPYHKNATMTR